MHIQSGHDSTSGYTLFKNANIFDSDSDLENLAQAMTVPHGAQMVSTQ